MHYLIQRKVVSSRGEELADTAIEKNELKLGSGSDQDIVLDGPDIAAKHAVIRATNRTLEVFAVGDKLLSVEGENKKQTELLLEQKISIGTWAITRIAEPGGFDAAICIEENGSFSSESIQAPEFSEPPLRLITYSLLVGVLLFGLALPLYFSMGPTESGLGRSSLEFWQTGDVSQVHHFGADSVSCHQCHTEPFKRVADGSCTQCHSEVSHHMPHGDFALAEDVAPGRCASCHKEHEGAGGLLAENSATCTSCHNKSITKLDGNVIEAASSFSSAGHPGFSVSSVLTRSLPGADISTPASKNERDPVRLKFNHQLHLSGSGSLNLETGEQLSCESCHEIDRDRVEFQPIRMEQHCIDCHQPSVLIESKAFALSHSSIPRVIEEINAFAIAHYAKIQSGNEQFGQQESQVRRLLPGKVARKRKRCEESAFSCGEKATAQAIDEQLTVSGCATCHEFSGAGADSYKNWAVEPVEGGGHWYANARFNHGPHIVGNGTDNVCQSCHDKASSTTASHLDIPDMTTCLECHDERKAVSVTTNCTSCHQFHPGSVSGILDAKVLLE